MSEHILSTRQLLAGITAGGALAAALTGTPQAQAQTLFVPGTGGTAPHAAAATSLAWLDGGRYGTDPVYCLCDSADYPAKLGPGEGDKSIAAGQESVVRFLLAHPDVDQVTGGSQGSMVILRALSDPRLAGRKLSVRLYSNPDTPGTGATARFPGQQIPTTGVTGGTPTIPNNPDVDITSVSHEWDPMAYFPKYAWTYAWTLPAAAVGFIVYHGALGGPYGAMGINYDGAEITQVGGMTVVKLRDPFTPYGQLAVIAATAIGGPQAGHVVGTLIKPIDDIAGGFLKLGGQDEPGAATFAPTPQAAMKQLQQLGDAFGKAAKDFAAIPSKLKAGPKTIATPPPTAIPSTAPDMVPLSSTVPAMPVTAGAEKPEATSSTQSAKPSSTKPKRPAPKASGNPVHDTVKTVQGALKRFAPKPKPATKASSSQHDSAGESK